MCMYGTYVARVRAGHCPVPPLGVRGQSSGEIRRFEKERGASPLLPRSEWRVSSLD